MADLDSKATDDAKLDAKLQPTDDSSPSAGQGRPDAQPTPKTKTKSARSSKSAPESQPTAPEQSPAKTPGERPAAVARPLASATQPVKAKARPIPAKARPIPAKRKSKLEVHDDPAEAPEASEKAIKAAPPWLVSLVFHMTLMVILGLLYIAQAPVERLRLSATYAEQLGEQLEEDTLQIAGSDLLDADAALSRDIELADDPLAAPPELEPELLGNVATSQLTTPSIGLALTGREKGAKAALLAKYGGTGTTEAAVLMGLEWLKKNQLRNGAWSLVGPYQDGGFTDNRISATAMALLAFQGAGNTHQGGPFAEEVKQGWAALLKMQNRDGLFEGSGRSNDLLYAQAQATIAICEIYGMTKDSEFREPAQRAIDYAVRIQAPEGGWRYVPGLDSDLSVTGWFVMALQSALMAGLEVPSPTLDNISRFLDSVASDGGALYRYQPQRQGYTPAMTAEALLCRQYLGWAHSDPRLNRGVAVLLENPIDWRRDKNVYYWYYATQVLHHMEGDVWDQWNEVMRDVIPKQQVINGPEKGSWSPLGDRWGNHGGRLFETCLCIYMLEVYYRHLPIYQYRIQK